MKKLLKSFALLFAMLIFSFSLISAGRPDPKNYDIIFSRQAALPNSKTKIKITGFALKNPLSPHTPLSFLVISKLTPAKEEILYRFAPVVPESVGYPRELLLEKAWTLPHLPPLPSLPSQPHNSSLFIITCWGETGADYFGTHPLVIAYQNGSFKAFQFYRGNLSKDPKIKDFSWTTPDFEVTNCFNPGEKVKTILTQGVSVTKKAEVELKFYGDNLAHAADHKYIILNLPLPPKKP